MKVSKNGYYYWLKQRFEKAKSINFKTFLQACQTINAYIQWDNIKTITLCFRL